MTAGLDVATHLATNVAELTLGTNCFAGPVRQRDGNIIPSKAVFCLATGGVQAENLHAAQVIEQPSVQIRVRSDPQGVPDSFKDGETLALACVAAIDALPPSPYFEARVVDGKPIYIGEDELEQHEWSINVLLKKCL